MRKKLLQFFIARFRVLSFEVLFWLFGGFVIGWFKYNSREIEYELLKGLSD
jgi:hypothetical protein